MDLLTQTEDFVKDFFEKNIDKKYVFHDFEHTVQTVAASKSIGTGLALSENELLLLQLATWFHDTGYIKGGEEHEERSKLIAADFLKEKISAEDLQRIQAIIGATKVPQNPKTQLEKIICDADLSHLGMKSYWERNSRLRQEMTTTRNIVMNENEWLDFELDFMLKQEYHTPIAREMFNKRKKKHIQQLLKQKRRLNPDAPLTEQEMEILGQKGETLDVEGIKKETDLELNLARMGRGVETMYRTTYRTHTNLSAMADSKANLMLSVNAIVISIIASQLMPKLVDNFSVKLLVPSLLLLGTCLVFMIFATLSTRPSVTEGRVTIEAIKQRKANLLFFGNFFNMKLEEFQWGVTEMLRDPEFLYSSMSRDLYYLGVVLAKKYKYLSYCYNIFMYGLIFSVLAFAISFLF